MQESPLKNIPRNIAVLKMFTNNIMSSWALVKIYNLQPVS